MKYERKAKCMFNKIKETGCICGREHKFTSNVIVEKAAIYKLPDIIKGLGYKSVFIFADKNTYNAAGKMVESILNNSGITVKKYVFKKANPEPDEASVGLAAMNFKSDCDVVIGVGSGVINDISKIIANVSNKKYIIVGTAPSMDGYASATSSMTMNGLKISLDSKCADYIIGDLDILCKAPTKMMISGLGDMLAKYVSICEWRISNLINGEYYCEEIADLVRLSLKKCVDNAEGLLKRDETAVKSVFEGLVICGAAMKLVGCSRPASGIEHYLSHIWDMRGVEFKTPVEYHGIQCAVGTLLAVELYEKIKQIIPNKQKAVAYVNDFDYNEWANELKAFLGKGADSMIALEENEQKYNISIHEKRVIIIFEKWNEILKIIDEELPSLDDLINLYDKVKLPKTMREIGISEDILTLTFKSAKDIRDKYVLPRLCWDLGIIDEIVEER